MRPRPGGTRASVAMGPGLGSHRGPGRSTPRDRPDRRHDRRGRGRQTEAGQVRPCGRSRRKKRELGRVVCGQPGRNPGPSLGGPRVEGPTARHRDEPGPEWRGVTSGSEAPPWGIAGSPARLRYRVDGDVPVHERARPSGRPGSANGGDRDHRGGPLVLGVGMYYQVSYRNNPPWTWAFPEIHHGLSSGLSIRPEGPAIPPRPDRGPSKERRTYLGRPLIVSPARPIR